MQLFVRETYLYKRFFALTGSIALQNLIVFSVNLADNIMLGSFQESSLSGVALVNQIQFLLQMLVMGVGDGMVILASRRWGQKDIQAIGRISSIGMRLAIVLSALIWAVTCFFPRWSLSLFSNDAAVLDEGVKYLRIICFSYVIFAVTNTLHATLRSVETVRIAYLVSFSTLICNVCFNYLLIFGNFGAPRLGVQGAAIATLISRIIELIITISYCAKIDQKLRLTLKTYFTFDRQQFRQYCAVGLPVLLSNAMWGLAMAIQTAILGRMGASTIAANSIATTVFQILSVAIYGSASATAVLLSKTIGEGHIEKVKSYAVTMQMLYLALGLVTGGLLYVFKDIIIQFYAVSAETHALALQFMLVLSVTVIGTAYQMPALTGIVRAGGDTSFVLYNDLIFMWLIVLPSSALSALVFHFPPIIVFICLKSDQILKCFVALIKVNRFRWLKKTDA